MLIPNDNIKKCEHSIVDDGACCCNCRYRFVLMVDNCPIGFVCNNHYINHIVKVQNNGHGMCECHEFLNVLTDKLEILT